MHKAWFAGHYFFTCLGGPCSTIFNKTKKNNFICWQLKKMGVGDVQKLARNYTKPSLFISQLCMILYHRIGVDFSKGDHFWGQFLLFLLLFSH